MPRGSNFYYAGDQGLGSELGKTLGRALFGDPEAAAQLALRKAQADSYAASAESDRAHAGLYGEQSKGVGIQNTASQGLPALIASMFPPAPVAVQHPSGPATPGDEPIGDTSTPYYPAGASVLPGMQAGLPAVIAAMAQMQGDKVSIPDAMQSLGAFMGGDELARRGLVAGGHSPDKDFAITPGRADDIRSQGFDATYNKDVAVARTNHATDYGVARINHANDVPVANANHANDIDVANIQAGARRDVASLGKTVGFSLVSDVLPGARMTSGERDPKHNHDVGGAEHSYHLPGDGVEAFDIVPGTGAQTYQDAYNAMRAKYGSRLVEAKDETHRPGHGPHWHFAVADAPGGKAAKAPKALSAASSKMIDGEIDKQIKSSGWAQTPDAGTVTRIREAAIARYQQTGNPASAVSETLAETKRRFDARQGGGDLRTQALAAIDKGADADAVRARYKKMTGKDLG